ncbi:hypothetical protein BASA62_007466 [Batrachochytrium salamandrivorans]|nr:hypothetical protein BASA62_007466 [Batrachochytrium salamandrivorans]
MFITSLTFTLALASAVAAVSISPKPTLKLEHVYRRSVNMKLPFHYPESVSKSVSVQLPVAGLANPSKSQLLASASSYLSDTLGVPASQLKVDSSFTDASGTMHIYGSQITSGGIRVSNHQFAVHLSSSGQVDSYSASFGTSSHFSKSALTYSEPVAEVPLQDAIATASKAIGIPYHQEFNATQEYVQLSEGNIVYAHKFQLRDSPVQNWMQVWVDAHTGQLINVIDFSNDFSYKAIKLPDNDPRDGFSLVRDPEVRSASPNGWTTGTQTVGNNVNALDQRSGAPGRGSNGVFDSNHNSNAQPTTPENTQTSAVNLFYIGNTMHDLTYQYGFTEATGNFQKDNFGKGGRGNDAVRINVLSTSGTNNANFLTPADGQSGIMNMFRFTSTNPNRDGGLDNAIPVHEYGHGISNRLTGGSATGQCLSSNEAGGMGEGWSDFFALVVTAKKQNRDVTPMSTGSFVTNSARGIRSHPYSTDTKINPLKFSDLKRLTEVHDVGEVWTMMLWEMYWNLVNKNGFSENLFDAKQSAGNVVAMQLVMGGLMNQPCNPTFISARDAILKADTSFYRGANKCDIISGFAKRGLGLNARNKNDDFSVPAECSGSGGGSQKTPGQTPDTPIGTPSRQPGGNPTTTTTLPRRRRTSVPTTKGGRRRRSGRTSITTNTTGGQTKRGGRTSS